MRMGLAAIALAVTAFPASAAFLERHEHWTVTAAGPRACAAFNRPLEEFNASPYVALSLRQRRGEPARLQVFAWPGAFKAGERVEIRIGPNLGTVLAGDDRIVRVRVFGDAEKAALSFDLAQIESILKSLDTCVRQLPQ